MEQERYELLQEIIQEKEAKGLWDIDLWTGTITTKRGVINTLHNTGYICVTVKYKGKSHYFNVHQVIAVAGGLNMVGKTINHMDGNKQNNSIFNLEVLTRKENLTHAHKEGLMKNWKLTKDEVFQIKTLMAKGVTKTQIAKMFNVQTCTLRSIARGDTHKDVTI